MTDQTLAAQLKAILAALREDLKPELQTPNGKLRADLMDMMLTRLATQAEDDGGPPSGGGAHAEPDQVARMDAGQKRDLMAQVSAFARAEHERRSAFETRVATAATAAPSGHRSGGELSIPVEQFTDYLRKKFPDDPTIRATKLVVVPGGRSKGTLLIDVEGKSTPPSIVLRRDFELSTTGTSVAYEYPVVKAVYEAGFPAPPPLWLEEDTSAIGGTFIAFERVAGKSMGTLFASDATPAFAKELAKAFARLHSLDVDALGLGQHLTFAKAAHPVRAMIEDFYARYKAEVLPNPLMDAAFTFLWLNIDEIGNERRIVHGDAGLHNTMGDGDKLTAVLDWEFCHAGDPAEDLTYSKYLIEQILPWDEFMAVYQAHGGPVISETRMKFFQVWRTLLLSFWMGRAHGIFQKGGDQDLRVCTTAFNTYPKQLRDLAGDLAKALSA